MASSVSIVSIRPAELRDTPVILQFIKELAVLEKLEKEVVATEKLLQKNLFCDNPKAFALIAESEGQPIGFCLYFYNFSTFLTRHGIYIEDMYVTPAARGKGVGSRILQYLSRKALAEGCGRIEWWVLDWNQDAIDFYRKIDAASMNDWTVFRLTGEALTKMAE